MTDYVARWLEKIGLGEHAKKFVENDIDLSILTRLSADDLKELGLSVGHRRRFLDAVANLSESGLEDHGISRTSALRDEAERRQLTVMFCDLVGSTELSRKLDPEDLREVIRSYQDACKSAIESYDGYIARYMGDGVLAYFGYPQAHEDAAERAVHAGLGLVAAMAELNAGVGREHDVELAVRVGIATGPVVVGDLIGEGASQESAVVGETPNLAARLQNLAKNNSVVISPSTHRITAAHFEYRDLGEKSLKGVVNPVQLWQVVRASTFESRFEAARSFGLTPMVGREEELGILFRRWVRAKAGEGHAVFISGEPGIGKSRLTVALSDRIGREPHTRLRYQCSPHYVNSALYPIISQLDHAVRFAREDSNEHKLEKLSALISQSKLAHPEDLSLLAALLSIPIEKPYAPPPPDPQQQREQTLAALVRQFEGLAERQPVLCIFEDVHWIDPSTLELLGRLMDSVPARAALLLLTFRPEFTPPWQGQAHTASLPLNRIGHKEIQAMVKAIAEGTALSDDVIDQIVARTDGIPLFVEELTKTLLEKIPAEVGFNEPSPRWPAFGFSIPTTLQDSLVARLDQLGPAKEVAQVGAVIGRDFSFELLAAVSPIARNELEKGLEKLIDYRLAFQRGSGSHATFVFKHALIRDAAYQSLLNKSRQQLHRRIAEVLEKQFPDSVDTEPELLAHHYTEAGVLESAVVYWSRAGRRAIERSANAEAVAHLTKALEVMAGLPESAERSALELDLQLALGPVLMTIQGWGSNEVGRVYERARALSVELDQPAQLFAALWGLWLFNQQRAEYGVAQGFVDDILKLTERLPDADFRLQAHHAAWTTEYFHGELNTAVEHARQGIELYDPSRHRSHAFLYGGHDPGVCARDSFAVSSWLLGQPDQAIDSARDAVKLAKEVEHPFSTAIAFDGATKVHLLRGEAEACLQNADTLIEICAEHRVAQYLMVGTMFKGWALVAVGEIDTGLKTLLEGLQVFKSTSGARYLSFYLMLLADAYRRAGQVQDGLGVLDEALDWVQRTEEQRWHAEVTRLKGELMCVDGMQTSEATKYFDEAIAIARLQDAKALELRACTSLARLWRDQGKEKEARDMLAPVFNWFTEGFDTADLKDAEAVLKAVQ